MKRLLALTISALLLCPMTSFAAQTEEAKAVYQEMMAKEQTVNDINAYYDMALNMTDGTDSVDMRLEMNARMKNIQNPSQLQYSIFARMTIPEEAPVEFSMYYADGYYYVDMLGQKMKTPMALDEAMEAAQSSSNLMGASSLDMFTDLSLRTEGENRILSYTMDDAKLNEMMNTILNMSGLNSLTSSGEGPGSTGLSFTIKNIHGEYIINPEGYYTKMTMAMDMAMAMAGESLNMAVTADIGIADPGQPVEISVPNLSEFVELPQ